MRSGINLSLIIWDEGDDPYDHTELASNWDAVDNHDHSTGKGKRIATGGLDDNAVTNDKLAPNSVTTVEILNGTILAEDIAPGAIGLEQINPAIFERITPLGVVVPWFRPSLSIGVPAGWALADGSTISAGSHGWPGGGNVVLPDLRNKFVLGAAISGTGTGTESPPVENTTGGAHSRSLAHTHGVAAHSHTVTAHSHTVDSHSHTVNAHSHTVNSHNHSVTSGGGHSHTFAGGYIPYTRKMVYGSGSNDRQAAYFNNFNAGDNAEPAPMDDAGSHNHGGSTGNATPATSSVSPGTTAAAPGTSLASPSTTSVGLTTDSANPAGASDLRPAYLGMLYIVKVKHA